MPTPPTDTGATERAAPTRMGPGDAAPPAAAGSGRRRSRWMAVLKTVVGVGLLATLLVWNDNGRKLLDIFGGFQAEYLLAFLVLAVGTNGVSSIKWGLFLTRRGHHVPLWRLVELYLIGKFFSNFLPSMFGGDLARVYLVGRQIKSYSISAASVFLERATGLVGLALLAVIGSFVNPAILDNPIVTVSVAVMVAGTAACVAAFYMPAAFDLAAGVADRIPVIRKVSQKVRALLNDIAHYRSDHRLLLLSMVYSLAFHLFAVLNVYVGSLAIGLEPRFLDIMVITPVILLLAMIPVSPNNIGWWEWCFSVLLVSAGATAAEGLAVGLVIRGVDLTASLVGGLLLLLRDQNRAPKA